MPKILELKQYFGSVHYIKPDVEYSYGYLTYFPTSWTHSENIIIWGHGSTPPELSYSEQYKFCQQSLRNIVRNLEENNLACAMPLLPRDHSSKEYPNFKFDAQILSQETMTNSGNIPRLYQRPDRQIIRILEEFKQICGHQVQQKVYIGGISAGANMANRISLLYPDLFKGVALLLAGDYIYPETEVDSLLVDYPFGVDALETIADNNFDKDIFLNLPQYIYIGELDDSRETDPLPYELNFNSKRIASFQKVFGASAVERTRHYFNYLQKHGAKVKLDLGKGLAHQVSAEVMNNMFKFLLSN